MTSPSNPQRGLTAARLARLASSALTLISLVLVVVWLYTRRSELAAIHWSAQWKIVLLLVGMYGFSLILNFVVWHSCTHSVRPIAWSRDLRLYAYSNLSRRLPSGLGYFFVRTVRYQAEDLDPSVVLYLSAQELVLQTVTGAVLAILFSLSAATTNWITLVLATLCLVPAVFVVRPQALNGLLRRVARNRSFQPIQVSRRLIIGWLIAYVLTWVNGGLMLHILVSRVARVGAVGFVRTMGLWTSAGSMGLLGTLVPLGQFARDAVLSLTLQSYMPLSVAAACALVFRLVLTVGDVVWSLILGGIGLITHKKY